MNSSEERLSALLIEFSEFFNITPPQTKDIREWWKNALYEMDKEHIYFWYETFATGPVHVLQVMRDDLELRKLELDTEGSEINE